MIPAEARLARLRGRALPRNHNARTISALAANPGCARRALLDAAAADKQAIAAHAGYPAPFGQSQFAVGRGNAFEAQLKESGAVAVLLNHNPDVPVHTLPVSWRLPASAAPVVSEAFYPFAPFRSATAEEERRLGWNTRTFGMNALDLALDTAAESGWALYELPHRHTLRTDREAVQACAGLAARLLERGAKTLSERSAAPLPVTPSRVAVGVAHRDQAQAVRARHRHACVVVARAGIPELLDAHPSAEPVHLGVKAKFPDGWEANQAVMAHLAKHRVPAF